MTGRRLRVRIRQEPHPGDADQNWSLFARLSPQTAQALCTKRGDECLEFLPLRLSVPPFNDPIYVSYNGGSINEEGKAEPDNDCFHSLPLMNTVHKLSLPLNLYV